MNRSTSSLGYIMSRVLKKLRGSAVRDSDIHATSAVESGSQLAMTTMGRHSFCGYDCTLLNVEIGPFCSIADEVYIGGSAHPMAFVSTSPVFLSHKDSVKTKLAQHDFLDFPRTTIGADVWIGHGAKVRAGVRVGHGAVIGMGAVVSKDVPDYGIVVGNPARLVRKRFDDEICDRLSRSRWWELSDEKLTELGPLVTDPTRFLDRIENP